MSKIITNKYGPKICANFCILLWLFLVNLSLKNFGGYFCVQNTQYLKSTKSKRS